MSKKLLSLEDLSSFFFNQSQSFHFSAQEDNSLIVQVDGKLDFSDDYDPEQGLLKVQLQACHIDKNANGSYISEETMTQAIPSFYNRPILGYIHKLDNGEYDFGGHEIDVDEDGNLIFIEIPVGTIPESCDAKLLYDEDKKKTYLNLGGIIYEDYTKAAEILKSKGECKVSVEVAVDEMSYDAKNKILNLDKIHFNGVTILGRNDDGTEIQEGMKGSNITLADFSKENNSLVFGVDEKSISDKSLGVINTPKSIINNNEKGGQNFLKLNELLEKYSVSSEELTFEIEGLSDEQLEAKFEEVYAKPKKGKEEPEPDEDPEDYPDNNPDEPEDGEDDEDPKDENAKKKIKKCTIENEDGSSVSFELSLNDTISAICNLVNETYGNENSYFGCQVYEGYVIMHDYCSSPEYYKQSYTETDGTYSLVGERVEVYVNYLTAEEEASLKTMKEKYSELKEFKESKEKEALNIAKNEVLSSADYEILSTEEAFTELKTNIDKYSVAELTEKADAILGRYTKKFTLNTDSKKKIAFSIKDEKKNKKNSYGSLFSK